MAAVADVVGISPSAVSQQISLLEEEVGVALVERRGRGVAITPAGEVLVHHAVRLLKILEEAKTDIAEMKRTVSGELVISSFPSIAAVLIPRPLRELQLEYPDLIVSATEMEPQAGLAALRSWQVDLAIIDDLTIREEKNADTLDIFPVYEDRIVVVMHRSHDLASRKRLKLLDLKKEFWAVDTRPNTFSDTLFEMCEARGFSPKVIGRFDAFDVISPFVGNRCAVAIMPQMRTLHTEGLIAYQFAPPIRRTISLAIRKGESRRPSLKILVAALLKHAGDIPLTATDGEYVIER